MAGSSLGSAWAERGVDDDSRMYKREFLQAMELMVARCVPVRGRMKKVGAPTIWRIPRRRVSRRVSVGS